MLSALAANTSVVLLILAVACGVLILAVIVLSLRSRTSRGAGLIGEDAIRRDLAEISGRLASLMYGKAVEEGASPHALSDEKRQAVAQARGSRR